MYLQLQSDKVHLSQIVILIKQILLPGEMISLIVEGVCSVVAKWQLPAKFTG